MKRRVLLFLILLLSLVGCASVTADSLSADIVVTAPDCMEVHFIDVGQADCILVCAQGETMLIDGGNMADSSLLVAYLGELGIDYLDYVVCTHAHEDHVGGLSGPLSQMGAGVVMSPVLEYDSVAFENFVKYTQAQGLELTVPQPGDSWSLGEAEVTVLAPLAEYSDANNTSIVLKVVHGENSFLFTGDAERESEEDMLAAGIDLSATVLKVGHHGSDSSTGYQFLYEVNPQYAVIMVGEDNSYGHPTDAVLSRLRDSDVTVYRTDMQGTIIALSDGTSLSFSAEKNSDIDTNPGEVTQGVYIGNVNSKVFHSLDCGGLPAEHNQIYFGSRQEAVDGGYTPCGNCNP